MTIGERIKALRTARGWSQKYLADKAGVSQQLVAKLETNASASTTKIAALARAFGITADDLLLNEAVDSTPGVGRARIYYSRKAPEDTHEVREPAAPKLIEPDLVPVLDWSQVMGWVVGTVGTDDALQLVRCPIEHGPGCFALHVRGESMTSSHGVSYPDGAIIFVDQTAARRIQSGDRVIARIGAGSDVTFKVFVEDGGRRFLKPLNPQHPVITEEFEVLGKVLGAWVD